LTITFSDRKDVDTNIPALSNRRGINFIVFENLKLPFEAMRLFSRSLTGLRAMGVRLKLSEKLTLMEMDFIENDIKSEMANDVEIIFESTPNW